MSLVDAYNATHDPDLSSTDWVPTLRLTVDPTDRVQAIVSAKAGAGKLGI